MANWHALLGDKDGNSYEVAYLIPIPSATNRVGVNYRTAIINSGLGGKTILPDGDGTGGTISSTDKTLITTGAAYEVVERFATNPGQTLTQLTNAVNARFTALTTSVQAALVNQLAYFGGTV